MRRGRWALAVAAIALAAALLHGMRERRLERMLLLSPPETILTDPALRSQALEIGKAGFESRCAGCHGASGKGLPGSGVPDLTDEDHLYGSGRVDEIEQIILHGIRSGDSKGWNLASMPAYASARPYAAEPIPPLSPAGVRDVTQFLLAFTGRATDREAAQRGAEIYSTRGGCYDCHGSDGHGDTSIGAPNLTDDVWLYGDGSADAIARTIKGGRAGRMPGVAAGTSRLEVRAIAVYTATLAPPVEGTSR